MTAYELDGRVAIITGGAGGMGSATARVLAEQGARIVIADLPSAPSDQIAKELADAGREAIALPVDLRDEDDIRRLIEDTMKAFGRIDILDNNAAAMDLAPLDGPVKELSPAVFDGTMAVNVRAPLLMVKHALGALAASGKGSIINISSGMGLAGSDAYSAYSASKAALNQVTRDIATQVGALGVRCNTVSCGLIRTATMQSQMPPPMRTMYEAQCLVPRLGEPTDIANMVLFLASDRSAYVTGQVIRVDGGFSAHDASVVPLRQLVASMSAGASQS
jgi:NAD(P)-dependent dehydrogenase (short-subunit alcohol dehydrogenase family)